MIIVCKALKVKKIRRKRSIGVKMGKEKQVLNHEAHSMPSTWRYSDVNYQQEDSFLPQY